MANSRLSAEREFLFLVDACAPAPRTPATNDLDWARVLLLARRHRVYPRVWARHSALFPAHHATAMRAIAAENAINALRNLSRTAEASKVLRLAGVECIALKGPLLAHDLYGDVALRVAGDVDLFVRERDLLRGARALAAAGYRPELPLTPEAVAKSRRRSHDLSLVHPDDGTLIELHADVAQPHYGYHIDFDEWWWARRPRDLGGEIVWSPGLEHAHLFSVLHAAKHRWHRLDLVSDIAAFEVSGAAPGGEPWMIRAMDAGQQVAAWVFDGKSSKSPVVRAAVGKLVAGQDFGRWDGLWFDLQLRDPASDKVQYLWRRLLSAKTKL